MKHGMLGIGTFWCITEMLYEENGEISVDECDQIAYQLRIDRDLILSILKDFELFKIVDGFFFSETIKHRLSLRREKSDKARSAASVRWTEDEKKDDDKPEEPKKFSSKTDVFRLSKLLFDLIVKNNKTHRFNKFTDEKIQDQIQKYCVDMDAILRIDERDVEFTEFLIEWCQASLFWKANILSMGKFRLQYDTIAAQAQRDYNIQKEKQEKNKFPDNHPAP